VSVSETNQVNLPEANLRVMPSSDQSDCNHCQ